MSDVTRLNIVAALLVTALEVAMFVFGMARVSTPISPNPIAVRLIAPPPPAPSIPADALPMIETAPVPQPLRQPESMPTLEAALAIETAAPPPMTVAPVAKPRPRRAVRRPSSQPKTETSAPPRETGPAQASPPPAAPPGGGTMGARALYKPLPKIPEELRRRAMNLIAVARFRVRADGGADVELIQPTPEPRLNVALLATLKTWRFFPAMANGRPVASTIDIRIPLDVR